VRRHARTCRWSCVTNDLVHGWDPADGSTLGAGTAVAGLTGSWFRSGRVLHTVRVLVDSPRWLGWLWLITGVAYVGTGFASLAARRVLSFLPWPRSRYERLRSRHDWLSWAQAELLLGAGCLVWGLPWVIGAAGVVKAWCLFAGFAAWALSMAMRYQADRVRR
jgi:hypothetical protein